MFVYLKLEWKKFLINKFLILKGTNWQSLQEGI